MKLGAIVAVFLLAGAGAMLALWPSPEDASGQDKKTDFAADREGPAVIPFDGKRAMKYLEAICALGPRMSGTESMKAQQDLIKKHFADLGFKVEEQTFTAKQISQAGPVAMTNLIVSFFPEKRRRVILSAHYDTRPIADQEPDPRKWREPFLSANDGGSGVAFLMELAQHMKDVKTSVGVDFVIFDGEEYFFQKGDKYFFGSEHFAKNWKKNPGGRDYVAAVLLDMIAGKNASFPVEGFSFLRARPLALEIWKTADDLRIRRFALTVGERVSDDHIALLDAGIPAVDIIDFEYPHWHRLSDTPANCSAEPMIDVARVLTTWMQRQK
jgi:glutaminyl-peptide cyclotransferase